MLRSYTSARRVAPISIKPSSRHDLMRLLEFNSDSIIRLRNKHSAAYDNKLS